ncbi:MAG: hypothetical protein NT031_07175 [Planctomycetota bacterium]|nr:hypothetical protein [Planctomycetota bacterium]
MPGTIARASPTALPICGPFACASRCPSVATSCSFLPLASHCTPEIA